jgi:hypothetical protein
MTEKKIYENFALTPSGYADYEGRANEVISQIVAGAPTLADLVPQTGIKAGSSTDLNILRTDITWSSANCVSTETGNNTTLKPRNISVVRLSDRELMCLDTLDAKVPQLQRAGAMNDELTFADAFINLKVKQNAKQLEKLAWLGNTSTGSGNLALADGFLAIANGETSDLAYYVTGSTASTLSTIIADVRVLLNNRTDEMFEMGAILYMSSANANLLSQALVDANLFNFGQVSENENGILSFMFPGTNVIIKGTYGLAGNASFFLTLEGNLRMGTDMENDKENVELFFDKYHKQLVSDIVFAAGFQYEFPEQVVYYKIG